MPWSARKLSALSSSSLSGPYGVPRSDMPDGVFMPVSVLKDGCSRADNVPATAAVCPKDFSSESLLRDSESRSGL